MLWYCQFVLSRMLNFISVLVFFVFFILKKAICFALHLAFRKFSSSTPLFSCLDLEALSGSRFLYVQYSLFYRYEEGGDV